VGQLGYMLEEARQIRSQILLSTFQTAG